MNSKYLTPRREANKGAGVARSKDVDALLDALHHGKYTVDWFRRSWSVPPTVPMAADGRWSLKSLKKAQALADEIMGPLRDIQTQLFRLTSQLEKVEQAQQRQAPPTKWQPPAYLARELEESAGFFSVVVNDSDGLDTLLRGFSYEKLCSLFDDGYVLLNAALAYDGGIPSAARGYKSLKGWMSEEDYKKLCGCLESVVSHMASANKGKSIMSAEYGHILACREILRELSLDGDSYCDSEEYDDE